MKEIQSEPWRAGQGVFSQQCVTLTRRAINIASNKFQIAVWLSLTIVSHTLTYAPKASPAQSPFQYRSQVPSQRHAVWGGGEGGDSSRSGRHSDVLNIVCVPQIRTQIWRLALGSKWFSKNQSRTAPPPHPEPFCFCHVSRSENTG